jgi:hypothetical protein
MAAALVSIAISGAGVSLLHRQLPADDAG